MAESVDALVSNTSGATHPGSIPGLGTTEKVEKLSPFTFYTARNHTHAGELLKHHTKEMAQPKLNHFIIHSPTPIFLMG